MINFFSLQVCCSLEMRVCVCKRVTSKWMQLKCKSLRCGTIGFRCELMILIRWLKYKAKNGFDGLASNLTLSTRKMVIWILTYTIWGSIDSIAEKKHFAKTSTNWSQTISFCLRVATKHTCWRRQQLKFDSYVFFCLALNDCYRTEWNW